MTDTAFTTVLPAQALLGECPVWAEDEQALYWVDIEAPSLNRFDPASKQNQPWPMPENIGCFGPGRWFHCGAALWNMVA